MLNFAEVWLARVIVLVTTLTAAPWLDGISELDTEVLEVGSGTASESNVIHIPIETFTPEVLINNTTYPIQLQAFSDTEALVQLDKYQTKVTTISDDQIMGASYARIDSVTRGHVRSITSNKYKKAIHALAPAANTANTPILVATGDPLTVGGRPTLTYADLVAAKRALDDMECPEEGRRIVLTSDHYNDLLLDKDAGLQKILVNMNSGKVDGLIAGFEIYSYVGNPYFAFASGAWTKKAFGSVPAGSDRKGSIFFYKENVAKKTGITKQYVALAANDPENQTNRFNYRHYFIAMPMQQKWMGAIV